MKMCSYLRSNTETELTVAGCRSNVRKGDPIFLADLDHMQWKDIESFYGLLQLQSTLYIFNCLWCKMIINSN